ncbi:imidazoleglycerol-phosphate dehydratase [Candidatus Vidania fulgoroideorum]
MKEEFFINRNTKETKIEIRISLNKNLNFININTGIPFFDHLLIQIPFHGCFSCLIKCNGDLKVDTHHIIEDVGIVLGKIIKKIFYERKVERFHYCFVPMDESLTRIIIDICNRHNFIFNVKRTNEKINGISINSIKEFFKSICFNSKTTIHIKNYGDDLHHRMESMFKCFGILLKNIFSSKRIIFSTKDI